MLLHFHKTNGAKVSVDVLHVQAISQHHDGINAQHDGCLMYMQGDALLNVSDPYEYVVETIDKAKQSLRSQRLYE